MKRVIPRKPGCVGLVGDVSLAEAGLKESRLEGFADVGLSRSAASRMSAIGVYNSPMSLRHATPSLAVKFRHRRNISPRQKFCRPLPLLPHI